MKKYNLNQRLDQTEPAGCSHGFTLVELLITMVIASFVLAAAFAIFTNYTRSNTLQTVAANVQQDIRAGISFMEQDVRSAGFNPRELSTGVGFTEARTTTFTFTSDNDFNGIVAADDPGTVEDETDTSPEEQITYTYNAGPRTLTRRNLEGTETLLSNISSLVFTYFDTDNGPIVGNPIPAASLDDIRSVNISITMSEAAGKYGTISRTVQTRIYCRNMNL
ncbi:MAG: prepilin-type N-terminal cleavage/methylation domain-containing protein [Desulfobacteraceae bacterium]|nr:MAG: prepilin-type N-terminal cleavage/methylation domain-containing protein [Desulfobacteraceae bacterium]